MIVKLLTEYHLEFLSLKEGCRDSSESTHVKMPHCWKSHATAHMFIFQFTVYLGQTEENARRKEDFDVKIACFVTCLHVTSVMDMITFLQSNTCT